MLQITTYLADFRSLFSSFLCLTSFTSSLTTCPPFKLISLSSHTQCTNANISVVTSENRFIVSLPPWQFLQHFMPSALDQLFSFVTYDFLNRSTKKTFPAQFSYFNFRFNGLGRIHCIYPISCFL